LCAPHLVFQVVLKLLPDSVEAPPDHGSRIVPILQRLHSFKNPSERVVKGPQEVRFMDLKLTDVPRRRYEILRELARLNIE
jgi:hypothetical protein